MSDDLNQNAAAPAPTPAPAEAPAAAPAPAPTANAPAPAPSGDDKPKYDYVPQKFLKDDGTPDFEKLAKSYAGLEKKLGSKPNIPASSLDEFEFEFKEGVDVDQEAHDKFKQELLDNGFSKAQYTFIMDRYQTNLEEQTWTADRVETALKESWGQDYETNTAAAQRAFQEYAPSDLSPHDPIWNNPAVMQLLASVGREIGEDSLAGKNPSGIGQSLTQADVDALMSSKDYWSNAESQAKVTAFFKKNAR